MSDGTFEIRNFLCGCGHPDCPWPHRADSPAAAGVAEAITEVAKSANKRRSIWRLVRDVAVALLGRR